MLWVADITYLRTGEGWLYLAAVQDTYSRQIVGWSMATHMRATLVVDALQMALARRRPRPGLIHHSDQGSQYVSLAFGQAARRAGISVSMGSHGDAYDNSVAETVLRDPEKGAHQPPALAVTARAAVSRLRVHRGVLQPPTPPLHPQHALPHPIRTATTLAARRLRSMTRTTTINYNNPVSPEPGQVHTPAGGFCLFVNGEASASLSRAAVARPMFGDDHVFPHGRCRALLWLEWSTAPVLASHGVRIAPVSARSERTPHVRLGGSGRR